MHHGNEAASVLPTHRGRVVLSLDQYVPYFESGAEREEVASVLSHVADQDDYAASFRVGEDAASDPLPRAHRAVKVHGGSRYEFLCLCGLRFVGRKPCTGAW